MELAEANRKSNGENDNHDGADAGANGHADAGSKGVKDTRTPAGKHSSRDRGRKGGTPAAADDGRRRGAGTAGAVRRGRTGGGQRRALKQQELYVPVRVQCPVSTPASRYAWRTGVFFNLFKTIFKILTTVVFLFSNLTALPCLSH
jgi:hypothetical protein